MNRVFAGMLAGIVVAGMAAKSEANASWVSNITVKGDARFRYQNTEEEGKDARQRWRFRGRLEMEAKVNEQVKANARLVTNTGDPISDNQTMTGAFDDKQTRFDRVFFTWTPADNLGLRFGKMSQPWIAVDDLVFSADVNPEGLAANYTLKGGNLSLMLHGGAFVVEERALANETMLYSGQAAVKVMTGEKSYVMVGGSVYAYEGIQGYALLGPDIAKAYGNGTLTMGEGETAYSVYATDYTISEGFFEAGMTLGMPLKVGAQYMVNSEADIDDTGYLGMFSAKPCKTVEVGYQYRYLEKDSALGVFAESTDLGNGTDVEGHIPFVKYQINKNFDVKVQYAMGEKGLDNGKDIDTFKVDLSVKF